MGGETIRRVLGLVSGEWDAFLDEGDLNLIVAEAVEGVDEVVNARPDTQSHVMPGMQKEAAEKIDAGLWTALAGLRQRTTAPRFRRWSWALIPACGREC